MSLIFECFNPPISIATRNLKCGDICIPHFMTHGVHNFCTVQRIDEKAGTVTLFRPYTHFDYFEYAGPSIICYTGVETFSLVRDETPCFVYERHKLQ